MICLSEGPLVSYVEAFPRVVHWHVQRKGGQGAKDCNLFLVCYQFILSHRLNASPTEANNKISLKDACVFVSLWMQLYTCVHNARTPVGKVLIRSFYQFKQIGGMKSWFLPMKSALRDWLCGFIASVVEQQKAHVQFGWGRLCVHE